MQRKFVVFGLICIIIVCLLVFTGCNDSSDEIFEFGLKVNNACSIDNVKLKDVTSVVIPSTHDGRTVKYIGRSAFEGCDKLTSVIIPEGVEEIDTDAFKGCTKLETISLPTSIKKIETGAFDDCNSLKFNVYQNGNYLGNKENAYVALIAGIDKTASSFTANSNCSVIYGEALSNFSNLKSIDLPYSIRYIGSGAFSFCSSIESFLVPNYVTEFRTSWFSFCSSLKSITISAGVETIYVTDVMLGCDSFSEYKVYSTNPKYSAKDGVLYSKESKTLLKYPAAKSGTNFSVPSYVESIAMYAFNGCKYLKSLTMWSTVKRLESSAVINCALLHTVNFKGTQSEWISLDNANLGWDHSFVVNKVICSDGTLNRSKA